MSTDTSRPERVTLSADEREALICDCAVDRPSECVVHGEGSNHLILHRPEDLVARVENILAAREQALREEITKLRLELGEWMARFEDPRRGHGDLLDGGWCAPSETLYDPLEYDEGETR